MLRFYTYSHQTADTGKIFYIGKGAEGNTTQRYKSAGHRNAHWHNIVNRHGFNAEILAYWDTEEEAHDHERLLISCFKDMGYKLANKTDGGEGTVGHKQSNELKAWRSQKMMGNQLAKGKQPRLGIKHSEATKQKISLSKKGTVSWAKGIKMSEETKAKISASKKGTPSIFKGVPNSERKQNEGHIK